MFIGENQHCLGVNQFFTSIGLIWANIFFLRYNTGEASPFRFPMCRTMTCVIRCAHCLSSTYETSALSFG